MCARADRQFHCFPCAFQVQSIETWPHVYCKKFIGPYDSMFEGKNLLITDWRGTCCCFSLQVVQRRRSRLKQIIGGRKTSNTRKPTGRDRRCENLARAFLLLSLDHCEAFPF